MESLDNFPVLINALVEIRNIQIIQSKFNPQSRDLYPDAYVYAVANSVYPYEHEQLGHETDQKKILLTYPFFNTYKITYEQVKEVANLLDTKWIKVKEPITFYDLEDHYSEKWNGLLRPDLIDICRYLYLCNYFDESFWQHFLSHAPTEASSLCADFNPSELEQAIRIIER